jgi:hypothetical protein
MIELHAAMLGLIRNAKVGAAFALARSIVESLYRGMYLNVVATDAEVQKLRQPTSSQSKCVQWLRL